MFLLIELFSAVVWHLSVTISSRAFNALNYSCEDDHHCCLYLEALNHYGTLSMTAVLQQALASSICQSLPRSFADVASLSSSSSQRYTFWSTNYETALIDTFISFYSATKDQKASYKSRQNTIWRSSNIYRGLYVDSYTTLMAIISVFDDMPWETAY